MTPLPPGEEVVLQRLARRWPEMVPRVVATWPGAVAVDPMPGVELTVEHPLSLWCKAARTLAEIAAGEREHVEDWLDLGVRDRRPATWEGAVGALLDSPVLKGLDAGMSRQLRNFVPEFITRYVEAFDSPATLVHQDSGCCNIHVDQEQGSLIHFDWADVVVGHPVFSCDRLLDQAPAENHCAIVDAFRAPLGLSLEAFKAMRRSNVLHEVLRYHDELRHMSPEGPEHASLSKSVCSQLRVLVDFESSRR